jgi:SagB-type dehydrogenase family enzyme
LRKSQVQIGVDKYALAISAWKQAGATRWALRCNPSSGNLHPTEGYLLIGPLAGLAGTPGLYHYVASEHGLERRADCPLELFRRLTCALPPQAFLVGLSSIHWREAWKYGERAFRYCQHDVGHAIGALRLAAATLGWSASLLSVSLQSVTSALSIGTDDPFNLSPSAGRAVLEASCLFVLGLLDGQLVDARRCCVLEQL